MANSGWHGVTCDLKMNEIKWMKLNEFMVNMLMRMIDTSIKIKLFLSGNIVKSAHN